MTSNIFIKRFTLLMLSVLLLLTIAWPVLAEPSGWFVVLGSFPRNAYSQAEARVNGLHNAGLEEAYIINTDQFSKFKNGLYAVVIGPFGSKNAAEAEKSRAARVVRDAYVKNGGDFSGTPVPTPPQTPAPTPPQTPPPTPSAGSPSSGMEEVMMHGGVAREYWAGGYDYKIILESGDAVWLIGRDEDQMCEIMFAEAEEMAMVTINGYLMNCPDEFRGGAASQERCIEIISIKQSEFEQ